MFDPITALMAFFLGIIGAVVGGLQTFVCTGFVGLSVFALRAAGVESAFLTDTLLNVVFLPAIVFNAASLAGAYAARHYDVEGADIGHSLIFTHDPLVMLMAGLGGLAGYLLYSIAGAVGLPADLGSFSVIVMGFVTRALFGRGHWINPAATDYYREQGIRYWVFQAITSVAICGVTAMLLARVDPAYYTIGFSASAVVLLLQGLDRNGLTYPTTHHLTLTVGYAMAATGGNIVLSVLFGMLADVVMLVFGKYCNTDCDTHIDPPAVAIEACSLLLTLIF